MGWEDRQKSWVDQVMGARSWAMQHLIPQPVVFHHIYKCGGTSVGRALRARYVLSQVHILMGAVYRSADIIESDGDSGSGALAMAEMLLIYHLAKGVKCVVGHVPFSRKAFDTYHEQYKFISTLRDPVARFISHYNYAYRPRGYSLEDYLLSELAKENGAQYVRFFCGSPIADINSDRAMRLAVDNLRLFSVIGFMEDLADFSNKVGRELNVRLRVAHENRVKSPEAVNGAHSISAAQLEKIRALCAADLVVYAEAKSLFA